MGQFYQNRVFLSSRAWCSINHCCAVTAVCLFGARNAGPLESGQAASFDEFSAESDDASSYKCISAHHVKHLDMMLRYSVGGYIGLDPWQPHGCGEP